MLATAASRSDAGITPIPDELVPFVAAINTTCLACAGRVAVAFAASLTRGRARIEPAPRLG